MVALPAKHNTKSNPPPIQGERSQRAWSANVRTFLRDGLGVEDIAQRLRCDVEHVRLEVKILRESGELEAVFRDPRP